MPAIVPGNSGSGGVGGSSPASTLSSGVQLVAPTRARFRIVSSAAGASLVAPVLSAVSPQFDSMTISWTTPNADTTGHLLEFSTNGGTSYANLATLGAFASTYSHTALTASTAYTYRVTAQRSAEVSVSNVVTASTLAASDAWTSAGRAVFLRGTGITADATSGTVPDVSGNSRNLILTRFTGTGAILLPVVEAAGFGKLAGQVTTVPSALLPYDAGMAFSAAGWTVEYVGYTTGSGPFFSLGTTDLAIRGNYLFANDNALAPQQPLASTPADGSHVWQFRYTGTALQVYVDGVLNTTWTRAFGPKATPRSTSIHRYWDAAIPGPTGNYANGLAEFYGMTMYPGRALTDTELAANRAAWKTEMAQASRGSITLP